MAINHDLTTNMCVVRSFFRFSGVFLSRCSSSSGRASTLRSILNAWTLNMNEICGNADNANAADCTVHICVHSTHKHDVDHKKMNIYFQLTNEMAKKENKNWNQLQFTDSTWFILCQVDASCLCPGIVVFASSFPPSIRVFAENKTTSVLAVFLLRHRTQCHRSHIGSELFFIYLVVAGSYWCKRPLHNLCKLRNKIYTQGTEFRFLLVQFCHFM